MNQTENRTPRPALASDTVAGDEIDLSLSRRPPRQTVDYHRQYFHRCGFRGHFATLSTPIYQAGAMLQVEEKAGGLPGLELTGT